MTGQRPDDRLTGQLDWTVQHPDMLASTHIQPTSNQQSATRICSGKVYRNAFLPMAAAECALNALDGPPPFEPPIGVCCRFVPRVIQGSFTTVRYFTSKYVNLAALLRVLKSQVKTPGSGGWFLRKNYLFNTWYLIYFNYMQFLYIIWFCHIMFFRTRPPQWIVK